MQGIVKSGPPKLVTPENLNQWIDLKLAVETIETKWGEYQAKIERASADLDKRKSESESLIVNENILQGRLKRQKELENDFRKMMTSSAVPRHAWIEQEAKLVDISGEISRTKVQMRQVRLSVIEAEASLALVHASERALWRDRLNEAERDIYNSSAELEKAKYRLTTNSLVAPVSGKVQQLSIFAPGSVAPSGQQVLSIVPDTDVEEVEVLIENKDIGFVRLGQSSEVKFEAYDYTRYGTLPAKISYISPDAVADERGVLRYSAKMKLHRTILSANGRTMTISPGMTVFVDIKSGNRSIISYFLSPILKTVSEAAREH
jgi:hemolysin D